MNLHNEITVNISTSSSTPLDLLVIEQDEWAPYTGYLTKANMVKVVANYLFQSDYDYELNCGIVEKQLTTLIYVYPLVEGLSYTLNASRGFLSERVVEYIEESKVIQFELTNEATLDHPARKIVSFDWQNDDKIYNEKGNPIDSPVITVQGNKVTLSRKVYGAVEIKTLIERHTYGLTIDRREASIQNAYSSVVFGVYEGGINYKILTQPPNSEELNSNEDADCLGGWTGVLNVDDQTNDNDPSSMTRGADRKITKDLCTGKTISDNTYAT